MNKPIMAFLTAGVMLAACSSGAEENSNGVAKESERPVQSVSEQADQQEEAQDQTGDSLTQDKWVSLPEYQEITKHIDGQDYTFETVTDNENKRILLLMNKNGEKRYKTIFIKNDNRLKVIKIDGGGQIFNGTIE